MSRIDELKKQYPELNITVFDMMTRLDTSKSYKYLPIMCKIFGEKFNTKKIWHKDDSSSSMLEIQANLINKGISTDGMKNNEMYYLLNYITEYFPLDTFQTLKEFMVHMDKGQIEKNDITSYKNIDDIRGAVTLATMKELTKELEGQIIKEYEDEKWVAIRPLTFSASAKYGSSTRWCTTYQREKQYFEKYWRRGILVYFINKQTGYKFAGYKGLNGDSEFSFWNAEDSRIDYLDVEADDYMFPIVRRIFKSKDTNKNLSSDEIQTQVHEECIESYQIKMRVERMEDMDVTEQVLEAEPDPNYQPEEPMLIPQEINEQIDGNLRGRLLNAVRELRTQVESMEEMGQIRELRPDVTYADIPTPTMRA